MGSDNYKCIMTHTNIQKNVENAFFNFWFKDKGCLVTLSSLRNEVLKSSLISRPASCEGGANFFLSLSHLP